MRPFGELHLGDQLRLDPGWLFIGLRRFARKRWLLDDQRLHLCGEGGQRPLVESATGVACIDELALVIDADQDGAEVFAAVARGGEAADHDFLLAIRLDLHPGAAAGARLIKAVPQLGDDPLELLLLGRGKERLPFADDVVRVLDQVGIAHDVAQQALAVLERDLEKALTIVVDDVEDHVVQSAGLAAPVLPELERRLAMLVEHHHLAIDDCLLRVDES